MHIFLAAVYSNNYMDGQSRYLNLTDEEKLLTRNLPNILESWHYVGKQRYVDDMRADHARIFLDSGAFSAYTLGVELKVTDYVEYIKRNMDIIRVEDGAVMASVLDGIGDASLTWKNQQEMEALGVKPLPCYHFGEDPRWLEWYVRHYDYITLGGMVGGSTTQLMQWLDEIWSRYLVDGSGKPKLKVHGFGITSIPIMERYPWYSCDSSSWIQSAAFGSIVTPEWGVLAVSDKSPSRHDAGQHISTLTAVEQAVVHDTLARQGFNYGRLSTIYESRAVYNLWSYTQMNDRINRNNPGRLTQHVQGLF